MTKQDDGLDLALTKATSEADAVFERLAAAVEEQIKGKRAQIDVLECAKGCGLEITAAGLTELRLPRLIHIHRWLPWHCWFPWRPLWCWYWRHHRHYHWYRCCPWWWYRCYWYRRC